MTQILLSLLILGIITPAYADEIEWAKSSILKVDINCDGVIDTAKIGYLKNSVQLSVTLGNNGVTQHVIFGLGRSDLQDSLCGTEARLSIEDMNYNLIEAFGANPEGFIQLETCLGLNIQAGECDSMHIFWNHKTRHINWWRL